MLHSYAYQYFLGLALWRITLVRSWRRWFVDGKIVYYSFDVEQGLSIRGDFDCVSVFGKDFAKERKLVRCGTDLPLNQRCNQLFRRPLNFDGGRRRYSFREF